uniref:ATP synthase complex subunit 8 n=2 Tax=Notophthalmus meridionalis TaxID=385657 RepID=A0A4P9CW23_9SALA|nr:ATP synthase F0 subunit 8 [Notophthalmus meridionalis]QCT81725.1 ATP synthase F0 subunit 8 [Notophthalmus meridionalis meridionalis]QCT81738.1 ATP synthase F0 subunit 8 [Notophthalmus meridionalis meridionalis]QCT81751.1 ATP synthase F0 subunit 8 [Notophthalmus meridionalis meridionalis]QCT81764.1 ATP synthase F0 subunit 8 [Notophthalmus meridionalis meridionalis]
MPQLNPGPWLAIFLTSWTIYLIIMTAKVNGFKYQNDPTLQTSKKAKTQPWNWPWI